MHPPHLAHRRQSAAYLVALGLVAGHNDAPVVDPLHALGVAVLSLRRGGGGSGDGSRGEISQSKAKQSRRCRQAGLARNCIPPAERPYRHPLLASSHLAAIGAREMKDLASRQETHLLPIKVSNL